jgi:septal ring factor EnvC (AmiA/AmiB activator)
MDSRTPTAYLKITVLRHSRIFWLLVAALFLTCSAGAQTKKQLEEQRNKLLEQIIFTKKQIEDVQKKKSTSLNQLVTLKKQIQVRERLIENYGNEVSLAQQQIDQMGAVIEALERDLQKLKAEYGRMLQVAYRNRSGYNSLLLILSARDFNQAYLRLRYLQQYNDFRQTQVRLINKTQEALNKRKAELERKKAEKEGLLREEETQKTLLTYESDKTNQLVKDLAQNERQLRKELQDKEAARQRLNKAIEDLIRREIEEARRKEAERQRAAGKKPAPTSTAKPKNEEFELTPEAKALGNDFAANQGKLPWPVSKGFVSATFGEHPHPVLKNVKERNDGVNIRTPQGTAVSAIFRGEVTAVVNIPGMQRAVIIRHGQYLTVYAHLGSVTVSKGDKVTTGQQIGTVYFDEDENKAEVHLQVWKGTTKVDPQQWIARK